jgi:hypothetical protein
MLPAQPADPMPHLRDLRRVSLRYQSIIPLSMMSSCHCILIGKSGRVLTVAFLNLQNKALIDALQRYTGYAIFPVYVRPTRLRLLLARLQRQERQACERLWRSPLSLPIPVRTMVYVITSQRKRR